MAYNDYLNDVSGYLSEGNLSDITVKFGEQIWKTHKMLLCSHSHWFRKAITGEFEEKYSKSILLEDDPEFADAIDCMITYLYEATYNPGKYGKVEPLVHAQVFVIADKYHCPSLFEMARINLMNTVRTIQCEDWVKIAELVYTYTTSEVSEHMEVRDEVIDAATSQPDLLSNILGVNTIAELLRSNAELSADLLMAALYNPGGQYGEDYFIFTCDHCQYIHSGSALCANVQTFLNNPRVYSLRWISH
ncbi:hypothetical protein N0V90_002842 [Kalmusia sp. IMI 367209]|nr:hypothetical protein N0V90_002842 [Kalmusia sp. IMI 367209]